MNYGTEADNVEEQRSRRRSDAGGGARAGAGRHGRSGRAGKRVTPPPPAGPPAVALEGATDAGTVSLREPVASPLEQLLAKGRMRATLAMLGPAFVASIAYVD